jgi:hypothetical protein
MKPPPIAVIAGWYLAERNLPGASALSFAIQSMNDAITIGRYTVTSQAHGARDQNDLQVDSDSGSSLRHS